MFKLRSRIAVLCADSDRILFYAHRERAVQLIADKTVKAEGKFLRVIGAAVLDVRPGSFGVNRQHVPVNKQYGLSGGIVFSHRNTYEGLTA